MTAESLDLGWRLHLDDADARPQHVEETPLLRRLELRADLASIAAVANEQFVEERLRLGALATFVERPVRGEASQVRPDLLAGQRHDEPGSDGESLLRGHCVEGGLQQPAMLFAHAILALFERGHKMRLGVVAHKRQTRALCALARLRDVEQNLLNFAVVGLIHDRLLNSIEPL
jgi:hypothetical protein